MRRYNIYKLPKMLWILLLILFSLSLVCIMMVAVNENSRPVVIIIGDSNSDVLSQVQVEKWSQQYQLSHPNQTIVNLAIGGHAIEDFNVPEIYQKLLMVRQNIHPEQPVIVVSLLGTNNAIMSNKIDTPDQLISSYTLFLNQVVAIARPNSVIIGSLPPVIVRKVQTKTPTDPRGPQLIHEFNDTLKKWVAIEQKIGAAQLHFVSILPTSAYLPAEATKLLLADGIHLNATGQSLVLANVSLAIETALVGTNR